MRKLFSLLVILLSAGASFGQQATSAPMVHSPSKIVDGRINPELIKDEIAYRLFFIAATNDQNDLQAFLAPVNLSSASKVKAQLILLNFRTQYEQELKQFNQTATATNKQGKQADQSGVQRTIDLLVVNTIFQLKSQLTSFEFSRLNELIQSEKTNMQVVGS